MQGDARVTYLMKYQSSLTCLFLRSLSAHRSILCTPSFLPNINFMRQPSFFVEKLPWRILEKFWWRQIRLLPVLGSSVSHWNIIAKALIENPVSCPSRALLIHPFAKIWTICMHEHTGMYVLAAMGWNEEPICGRSIVWESWNEQRMRTILNLCTFFSF